MPLKSLLLMPLLCIFIFSLAAAPSPDEKLFDGLRRGDLKIVESALEEGASPDLADPKGVTILMMAVTFGQTDTVKILLEKGADVNRQDADGNTAMMRAAANNRVEIAKLLIEKNADFFEENKNGETCLSLAISKGFPEFASLMIKPGMGEITYQMLMAACRSRSEDVLKLIEAQAPLVGEAVKSGTVLVPFSPWGRGRDRDRKWGFIDVVRHDVAIHPIFDRVEPFDNGQSRVKVGKNWGIIDLSGRYVMKPSFEAIKGNFAYGSPAIPVKQSGKWGFADKAGSILVAPSFDDVIFSGKEEIIPVRVKNLWGFVDRKGEFVVKPSFEGLAAGFFTNTDLVPVRVKRKWGFVDRSGRIAIEPAYEYAKVFSQGLAPVRISGKWGYIDASGKTVIPPKFDDAMPFDEYGYACIRDNSKRKFGCIDKSGKVVIDEKFDCPIYFSKDGTAFLSVWRVFFRIDNAGAIIAPICFTGRNYTPPAGMPLWRIGLFFVLPALLVVALLCFFFFRRRNKWAVRAIRFSLIELLVVVCIICILAGLLLPALSTSRTRAQTIKCQENLRQMDKLTASYIVSNHGYYPTAVNSRLRGDSDGWLNLLADEQEAARKSFVCPIEKRGEATSYSINTRELYYKALSSGSSSWPSTGEYPSWRDVDFSKSITGPSRIIIVYEANYLPYAITEYDKDNYSQDDVSFAADSKHFAPNHGNSVPMLFVDGHVTTPDRFDTSSMTYYTDIMSNWFE